MLILELPAIPDSRQLDAVVRILDDLVGDSFQKGVQIFRGRRQSDHARPDEEIERLVRGHIPSGYVTTLHAPIAPKHIDLSCRLDCEESEAMVARNIALAGRIGARSLIVHAGTSYFHPMARLSGSEERFRWRSLPDDELAARRSAVYERIAKVAKDSPVRISIENEPLPINADSTDDPTDAFINPYMTTYKQLFDFVAYLHAHDVRSAGICFDTAHYIRTVETIKTESNARDPRIRALFGSVSPDADYVPLRQVVRELLLSGKLYDIQLAESVGWHRWGQPPRSFSLIGGSHEEDLIGMLEDVKGHMRAGGADMAISLDIDEADYLQRPKQRESLQLLVDVLSR